MYLVTKLLFKKISSYYIINEYKRVRQVKIIYSKAVTLRRKFMNWKFWKNNKRLKEKQTLEMLIDEVYQTNKKLCIIEEYIQKYDEKFQEMNEHIENNEDLIQKSLRVHFKSNQEITKKLEQINDRIDKTVDYSKKYVEVLHDKDNLIKDRNFILEKYIQWLDDIDLIYDKLNVQGQEYWISLLKNWQSQIIKALEVVGIFEIDILGNSFRPAISESVSTKKKEKNKEYKPYEGVDVLQRGFVFNDGTLLRKAKVITIDEGDKKE